MNKLHKRYILLSTLLSSLAFGIVLLFTYIIDPAGVNNRFDLGLIKDERLYNRTQKYIEIQKIEPNTIIFGGSRVHFLNTNNIKKYTQDKVYNLAFSSSTLEEQYYFLKYSIEKFDIKNVIIGLNLYPFSEELNLNEETDFDKDIFKDGFTFQKQIKYVLEVPLKEYLLSYFNNKLEKKQYLNGSRTIYSQNQQLNNLPWKERKSNHKYINIYKNYLIWGDKGLNILKNMVNLCNEKNINLKVFTTAIYVSQLQILEDLNKMDIYYKWKKELAKITPYYDFMYSNSITRNSDNYINPSHIRIEKGYLYFAKIFEDTKVKVPNDFGRYVDEYNINKHLLFLKEQFNKED